MALPPDLCKFFSYALSLAQAGDQHDAAKVLKGFGGAGVVEVVADEAGGTCHAESHLFVAAAYGTPPPGSALQLAGPFQ